MYLLPECVSNSVTCTCFFIYFIIFRSKYRSMSIYKDKILSDLQRSTTEDKYIGILRIIESFNSSGEWCFLSEYYPKNLKQALMEYGKCFHIDRVQFLARQLVAAVTTLTKNQIIHAGIILITLYLFF